MINEINLQYKDMAKFTDIAQELYAVPECYLAALPQFDSRKIRKCIIYLHEKQEDFQKIEDIVGCGETNQLFDFDKYVSLNRADKAAMQLDIIHAGMLDMAARYGWDTEPLETAYGQCFNSDLIFYRQLRKNKLSPNKKQYLSVFAYCDFSYLKISWQVSDRKKNIQYKGELAWWPPSNIDEIYGLDFQWINDSEFVIHSKYKGIRVNSWQIGLAG